MIILVLTDEETKSLKYILKEYMKNRPDKLTIKIIERLGKRKNNE